MWENGIGEGDGDGIGVLVGWCLGLVEKREGR